MTTYVAFVAIGNVILGFMLARYLPPETMIPRRSIAQSNASPRARSKGNSANAEAMADDARPSSDTSTDQPSVDERKTTTPEPDEPKQRRGPPPMVKSWDEFAHQLRELKERTRFCRPAQNMNLARQAAEQLRACAQVWYAQFESLLSGAEMDDAAKALVAGAELGDIEMFAAQIETSLTNVNAIDWQGSVDEVLNCLDRELELLDAQQRKVAKNVKATA